MHFLREQFWKILMFRKQLMFWNGWTIYLNFWLLIGLAGALYFHGCWSIFFIRVFTTSKIDMYKYKFKMYKILWITVNQANRWARSVFQWSVWSPANFKEELPVSREALIKEGWAKNFGKEPKVKNACG